MRYVIIVSMGLLCAKTIFGFRWPWEICSCCKKKMRDHVEV